MLVGNFIFSTYIVCSLAYFHIHFMIDFYVYAIEKEKMITKKNSNYSKAIKIMVNE